MSCKVCGMIIGVVLYEHKYVVHTCIHHVNTYVRIRPGCYDYPLKHPPVTEGKDQPFSTVAQGHLMDVSNKVC